METFRLFSRARRLGIQDAARRDVRESKLPAERVHAAVAEMLLRSCPGLIGHSSAQIVSSLGDSDPGGGLLPRWSFRVKVDSSHFIFTLTRQSAFDGSDPRDQDGYEKCWFVWSIALDGDGGSAALEGTPTPSDRLPVGA